MDALPEEDTMSTSFYRLKSPITHLRLEDTGGHDRLSIWVNHAFVGTLTLAYRETRSVIGLLADDDDQCPLRTHWGGSERGAVVTVNDPDLPDEAVVISEYDELLTIAQVKARDGAKRADGMPTELFGYEENITDEQN